jgi:hypothetical protein
MIDADTTLVTVHCRSRTHDCTMVTLHHTNIPIKNQDEKINRL